MFYTFIFIISVIIIYLTFVIFFRLRLNELEKNLMKNFKKRNDKIISLYFISKNFLSKHDEVFSEYKNLKIKDFSENSLNFYFENKVDIYKKFHKEMDFIFKVCEMNEKIKQTWKYNYIKYEILKESKEIWKKYDNYKKIFSTYKIHHKISKIFIIWLFLR